MGGGQTPFVMTFLFVCFGVQPINNVVIVSGEQRRDSAANVHVSFLPQTPLPCRLPYNIEQSSMCYTVGPGWLSILNMLLLPRRVSCAWWTGAHQAPLSMGFSRQEYWSGLPCSHPGDLPDPGVEPASLMSPELAGRFFTTSTTWEAPL